MTKISSATLSVSIILLMVSTVHAAASVVNDPVGDGSPAYLDMVKVSIAKKGGIFLFAQQLAVPIPAMPSIPVGSEEVAWGWDLDTDPSTAPPGWPAVDNQPFPFEFLVLLSWDGTSFTATVIDRRPLLTGGQVIITAVPFTIKDDTIKLFIGSEIIGNPSSFQWVAVNLKGTLVNRGACGPGSNCPAFGSLGDIAPDTGLATFTS